jgi:hypothetical protein
MAIQITYFDEFGANHTAAYCKIMTTSGYFDWDRLAERDHCDVAVGVFHDITARNAHAKPLLVKNFKITEVGSVSLAGYTSWLNFLYGKIKTDSFFTTRGGIDV